MSVADVQVGRTMKAIALVSGGLDSTLAVKVVIEQGIDVVGLNFLSPFCLCNRKAGCKFIAKKIVDEFGIELKALYMGEEYIEIIKNPRHGYGKNLNPCIDCRILMLRRARDFMQEIGASFIITGEVLGQRPMSQYRDALRVIERESGLEGLLLRPLSAKLLPLSTPEKEGWVDREKLLEISGRSRKPQLALAKDYKISTYACAAGGCLLTDKGFANRMRDLMAHSGITLDDIGLLKVGRHFRLSPSCKIVVGRNKEENEKLMRLAKEGDLCFDPVKAKGPVGIGQGDFDNENIQKSVSIITRYCDGGMEGGVEIESRRLPDGKIHVISAEAMAETEIQKLRI